MKTNYANFYFRSLCIKLVALRMNLYQEAVLVSTILVTTAINPNLNLTSNLKPRVHNLGTCTPRGRLSYL